MFLTDAELEKIKEFDKTATTEQLIRLWRGNDLQDNQMFDAVVFCLVIMFYIENLLKEVVVSQLKRGMNGFLMPEIFDCMYDQMMLSGKIKIIQEIFSKNEKLKQQYSKFVGLAWDLNSNLRNNLFHVKLDQIKYDEKSLLKIETQRLLSSDLREALVGVKKL